MSAIDSFLAFKEDHPWVVILTVAFVAYTVIDHIQELYLRKKLGAKPFRAYSHDYTAGFRLARTVLISKKKGEMVDFTNDRYKSLPNLETTFHFRMLGRMVVATREPENIKAMLATQFNDFCLGTRHRQFLPLLGDGIFTLDGEGWKHSRAMLRPQFAREQVAHVKVLEPHLQTLGQHIRKHKGKKFDIQELFFRLTVDSATEFLFGESVSSLQDASIGYDKPVSFDGKAEFAESFNLAQSYLATRTVLQDFYFLMNPKKFKDAVRNVHAFADYYVQKALDLSPEELEKYSDDTYDYVFLYELAKQTRNPKVLRDQLLNILIAGRDTTAGLLSFIFYELARNPGTWAKLKEEIYEKFGSGEDSRVEDISFESLKKCEYLKAVINECLRLYPSVPVNFRVAQRNTTLPRGGGDDGLSPVLIRKGQTVVYSVYCTHRDKIVYGEDAEEFRPERWFEPSTKKLGWSFLPFNGGPRICLGQQFALTEASYIVTRLAQMFPNIESHSDETIPKKQSHLTMSLDQGCQISLY